MPELAKESVALFGYLLPGFLAAWVLYGLTSDPKPSQFERVVQALIFTFLVHALIPPFQWLFEWLGTHIVVIRPWDETAKEISRMVLAILLGAVLAVYSNTDGLHSWLRSHGLTTRTAYPSEWFSVFSRTVTFVVLHMHDERRLYGWPKEWPNDPEKGHFFIMFPSWLLEDGNQQELPTLEGLLVQAKDVKWVEFLKQEEE